MVSSYVESFTSVTAVVAVFFLSTGTSPAMSEGECDFGSNDVLDLVHNEPSRGRDNRWVRGSDMYPGLLCQIRGSGGTTSLSDPMFYKNGVLLAASSRISGSTLTFPNFTVEDQGQYECGCISTVERSNEIILLVTPPKSGAPPSFVVKYGNEVTIDCPLIFLTFGDLPQLYAVDWRNLQDVNLVEGSMVMSPMVSFDNQTLQLTILNVTSDEDYRCVITHFDKTSLDAIRFSDTHPSDPVRIRALGRKSVSVELQPPTIATGETTTIKCSQASPSYNPVYRLEMAEDDSTEPMVYQGISVYNYTAKSVSVNVTCTVTQRSNGTTPQEMVNDTGTQRIFVVGDIQLNGDELRVQDDKGCIQVLRVEYTSMPTTMELMYTVTPDRNEPCPPTTRSEHNTKSTSVPTDGYLHVNLTGVTHDGTRVDLYVRAWMRHDGVNGKCSDAVMLKRADETCFGTLSTLTIAGIAVAAMVVGIIIIAIPVCGSIIFCRWLRRRGNEVDFPQEDPRDRMRGRKK